MTRPVMGGGMGPSPPKPPTPPAPPKPTRSTPVSEHLDTYTHRGRTVQALPYTTWPNNLAAVMWWADAQGFDCYRERDRTGTVKIVIRVDAGGRDEVVARPGCWVVFDLANRLRLCRVQVWSGFEFGRQFRRRQVAA